MTPAEISQYLGLALAIIALLGHARGYFASGEKTLAARIEKADGALVAHERRIQSVESEIKHLPDKDTVYRLQVDLTEMKGQLSAALKSSEATERGMRRVEEFLLNKAN